MRSKVWLKTILVVVLVLGLVGVGSMRPIQSAAQTPKVIDQQEHKLILQQIGPYNYASWSEEVVYDSSKKEVTHTIKGMSCSISWRTC